MQMSKLAEPTSVDLVLGHGECFDGFTSMWIANLVRGPAAEYREVFYSEPAPDVTGRNVAILDFSYDRITLERMAEQAKSLIVIDHHETNERALKATPPSLLGVTPLEEVHLHDFPHAIFDMQRSGARMTFDWFLPHLPAELVSRADLLTRYVQDRDLWRWALPHSREVTGAMMTLVYDFEAWTSFSTKLEREFESVVLRGAAANDLLTRQSEKIAQYAKLGEIDGHPAWLVNCPYTHASDVGNLLAARTDGPGLAAVWRHLHVKERLVVSLRSSVASGVNVARIAEARGGGGHARAASFEMHVGTDELPFARPTSP